MSSFRRKFTTMAAVLGSATVFQLLPTNCAQFFVQGATAAFDFCSVLNCTGSSFFDFCDPVVLLQDCITTP
jgi:hypothetical protein